MNWKALLAVVLVPSLAFADPPAPAVSLPTPQVVTYPPGDDKIVVLHKGDPAPFVGQLFDDNTALRWAVWLQQYKSRYGIDMQAAQSTCDVKLDHAKELSDIETDRNKKSEADLEKRLAMTDAARIKAEYALQNPSFFKEPGTWFAIGIITTLVTAVVSVEELKAATK